MVTIWLTAGRVLLASLFVLGGINKVLNYAPTQESMIQAGLTPAEILLPLTILLEFGGGLMVMWGRFLAVPAALALAVFTLATNYFFHDFWTMSPPESTVELSLFFKNISVVGGLLFVAGSIHSDENR